MIQKYKYFNFFVAIIILFQLNRICAQDNVGFNFIFLTHHPGGNRMAFLQPNKLDKQAKYVLNWGGALHYERFIYRKRWSIKLAQAMYSDCARLFAGHTHIAFRANLLNGDKHSLRIDFGPTWVYRQSWHRFPGYEQENRCFKLRGDWDYVFRVVWWRNRV